jgi:hypothetical protein
VSYRARLIVCELETSTTKRPDLASWAAEKVIIFICCLFKKQLNLRVRFLVLSGQQQGFLSSGMCRRVVWYVLTKFLRNLLLIFQAKGSWRHFYFFGNFGVCVTSQSTARNKR